MLFITRRKYQGKLSKILKSSSQALMGVSEAYYAMAGIYSTVNFYEQEEIKSLGSLVSYSLFLIHIVFFQSYFTDVAEG
jgi:hypothetical protein